MTPAFGQVTLEGVEKVYGRQRALGGVNLTLKPGCVTALLGTNGAGKSTLVGVLSTLVRPTRGRVLFGDLDPTRDGHRVRARIGLIAHSALVYPDLSGLENLKLFARLYRVDQPARRAVELIEQVGLTEAAHKLARTYSRGMLQRLAVARALVGSPYLILADEPFTGLDRPGTTLLRTLLQERRRQGALVVLVTHDLHDVAELADEVVVLRRGRVTHVGPASPSGPGNGLQPGALESLDALYREFAL